MLKDPGADDAVDESDEVEDEDEDEGDVDIDEKQLLGDSTLMEGVEEPATDTVNMFLANESADAVDN